jgi:fibro-slime domain-containing protein
VLEAGFACENETAEAPKELALPIVYRDFWVSYLSGFSWSDAEKGTRVANTDERAHPDFEQRIRRSDDAPVTGMVKAALGQDGKPVYDEAITAKTTQHLTHGKDRFAEWFRDVPGKNVTRVQKLILTRQGSGDTYAFDSGDDEFFPLDACPEASCEGKRTLEPLEASWGPARTHNFGFTSEVHHWFTYRGGETLTFSGDDDVWVFVDGRLVVDLGGLHPEVTASVTLSADTKSADGKALGLIPGGIYQIDVFHAERQATGSNYRLTLGGFSQVRTACDEKCGDGKVSGLEACDDGNTRDGDGCSAQCRRETEIIR